MTRQEILDGYKRGGWDRETLERFEEKLDALQAAAERQARRVVGLDMRVRVNKNTVVSGTAVGCEFAGFRFAGGSTAALHTVKMECGKIKDPRTFTVDALRRKGR